MNKISITVTVLAVSLPLHAAAQVADPETAEIDTTIDEITAVGARTLGSMRTEVVLAEDEVYALYNDLNEDDGYDIICKKETRIGSQIPRRVCLARMYREAVAEATVDEDTGDYMVVGRMTGSSKHQKILQEKMRALAIEHPELSAALKKRHALAKKFQEERDKKYAN
ncbi:MAG: hypothetical protein OEU90_08365 [Gammaproteobacteria bacterium]|jgi:hypothetical protein|nr:hypothetical protein [Gammaproteobacteria bacterium]MDH3750328.1 hypothetical protein [Gammaproteobacteria bacterium]MDH3805468.1 hypothetical protein [Gammaproteobacteria bacterium]